MKKSKLIKLLNSIDGDPDILFWNGMLEDYQDFDSTPIRCELYKQSFDFYKKIVELERRQRLNDYNYTLSDTEIDILRVKYKKQQWQTNDYITDDDIKDKKYKRKNVMVLNARPRNQKFFSRGIKGCLQY